MLAQQYKLPMTKEALVEAHVLGFVFTGNESNSVIGFVSATDNETFIEFTLFNPRELEDKVIDAGAYDIKSEVDYKPLFSDLMDSADRDTWLAWVDIARRLEVVNYH